MWIPVSEDLPKNNHWVIAETTDGTVYPAVYTRGAWTVFGSGSRIEALFHGSVAFWQPHEPGLKYATCECGRKYFQQPGAEYCPVCTAEGKGQPKEPEEPVQEETEEPVQEEAEQVEQIAIPEVKEEEKAPAKKTRARKPKATT